MLDEPQDGEPSMDETAGLRDFPLARRGFVMTALISGLTLATTRVEAQAIHTDATGLDAGEVSIPVAGGALPAYYARPAGSGPFPIMLVVEEVYGVHEYIKDICRRLAHAGYLAVAAEYYARLGDLSTMSDPAKIMADVISKAPDALLMTDIDTVAQWAGANHGDGTRLGLTGFCRGGRVAWLYAAHSSVLKAAVAWYGPLGGNTSPIQPRTPIDVAGELHCPLLGLYGGKDGSSTGVMIETAEAHAKAAGKTVEFVVFPDAPHAFHADYRPSYRKADAEEGWRRMLAWFKRYGVA